jgi:putative N-acetylmannosamine-6-phosphate epimerase
MAAREEGKRRRQNLINKLIIQTVGLIIMTSNDLSNVSDAETDAMEFMKYVSSGISDYYEYGSKKDSQGNNCKLIQDVMSSTYTRLDNFVPGTNNTVTIRQFIISKLDV